jgi:glycosyltransferase involved in cell wall biosynthesis
MRVLFVSETSIASTSGSAQLHRLDKLSQGLRALGIETAFLSLRDMPFGRPFLLFPLNLPFVWSELRRSDFCHAVGDAAYAAALWRPVTRTPVVYDVDADTLAEAQMRWDDRPSPQTAFGVLQTAFMNWIAYRSADRYITVSRPLLERLATEKKVPRERLHLVRNGVDTDLFRPAFRNADGPFTVCYAGGFHIWQGIENLVAAAQMLKGKGIRIKIVGFRREDAMLKARIAASLGDMAELVDRVSQTELADHLSRAHAVIIPRLRHPAVEIAFPTKFSEYLAMGKPVIVSDVDETAAMVREHDCGLVSDPTPQALAETILCAASLEEAHRIEMGQNGRYLAESVFDWRVVCGQYAQLLWQWHGGER